MRRRSLLLGAVVLVMASIALTLDWQSAEPRARTLWRQAVLPGKLSGSHAFIGNDCAACHTSVKGVQTVQCISCHANETALLQRQPTAFHAQARTCVGCHIEHQGGTRMPTTMDHALLARIGHAKPDPLSAIQPDADAARIVAGLPEQSAAPDAQAAAPAAAPAWPFGSLALSGLLPGSHVPVDPGRALDCAACHATKDRHQRMFGSDCAACHTTDQWRIAQFRHPSPRSMDCAQCHRPPPSHNMMHFGMVSARVVRQPGAQVNQCYLCHQTTSWNDIKGVGLYKHH